MLTVKSKGNSTGQRYIPVSEFDDATLAQKREYWRNKKREQRARRSEKRQTTPKPNPNSQAPASSFPLQDKNGSNVAANNVGSLQNRNIRTETSSDFAALHCQKQQLHLSPSANTSKMVVKCMTPENTTVNSMLISQLNSNTSVPPFTKSHSFQPYVPVHGSLVPKTSQNSSIPVFIQPKPTTNIAVVSSPCSTKSTLQLGKKSALVIQQKPINANISPAKVETEEEKAAKRRELWRVRKREQRERLAARLGKTKNRAQNDQKQHSSNGASMHILSQSLLQSGSLMKTQNLQPTNMTPSIQSAPPLVVVKRPFEPIRKGLNPFHLSGVMRARCPTPRQRLLKLKSPSLSYLSGSKGLPPIDPSDTPEQVIAKRREYWRVKKREQRAKLSVDVKLRLKEKGDFQRRVKRYHKILEDMRKARSQAIMHASETIGGFIKEDGTVTINIPQVTVNYSMPAQRREQVDNIDAYSTQPQTSKHLQSLLPHPPLVKTYNSPLGHQPSKSRKILTDKSQTIGCSSSQIVPIQAQASHLTLTPASLNPGSTTGGCVMKMAVSCKAPSPVKAYLDPSLTEEERMAKRREYWRVKKREQRASRAIRLRQSHSQVRASAVLLKRKAQRHVAAVPLSKRHPKQSGSITNNMAYVNEMKQVNESMPAVDLNLNQAICPELKPPVSRTPPPAQADPDPALSADNQATTLLAVASMKKLLEESLSSVSECKPETGIKMETEEEKVEQDTKPDLSQDDVCAPVTADVMLQTESSQTDTKMIERVPFEQKDMFQITPSTIPYSAPDNTTDTSSFIVNPRIEASECPQRRTQRTKKTGHQHCCSPGPPKLHHPPIETQAETQDQNHHREKCPQEMPLEQKREYWKLMKRQQRARLKARQRSSSNVTSCRSVQSSGCVLNKNSAIRPALLPKLSTQTGTAAPGMPTVLLVSPTVANAGPQGTLRVKSPVCSRDTDTGSRRGNENINVNTSVLPTLKPPDNPLSSMNMQPIEPPSQNFNRTLRSITIPCPPKQNNPQNIVSRSIGTITPPKRIPGESEEDFQKRKREYWRIKKKEQRARKAFHDKDKAPDPSCSPHMSQYMPQDPLPDQCEQESNEWLSPSVEPEDLMNNAAGSDVGSFQFPNYSVPIDGVFTDYESPSGEEGALSGDFWRNHYLMDHDPLNQLLVCMVCGELQYVHSVEGVRGHIEEAHPHTLSLDSGERHRILQAWDEQVFHRERFFTNQLQQHSASMTEAHMN
ncbi:uncharacterized protein si:dkey-28a3.2 [Boleophthalmus pectinirostris]|uniref:uncharacterized protein si:dkey-28a3.2 n=1 Tax=Boleophthalmus pectinirostris TaxID=150288 RepID=UPI002430781B|nr:uncharacterized protein si:dkey-28a3.2 [Boleophthalmus pectinirostris]